MTYDAIIVGGGIAGLTAAAYLSKAGKSVLLCEQQEKFGGLVNTFERDGFTYDGGVRALEDSGVLFPMLRQLGISLDFVPNTISVGIEDKVVKIESDSSVEEYKSLLDHFYPEQRTEIELIMKEIRKIMHYMEVQYGIDNPIFLDMKKDQEYLMKKILPWLIKYAVTVPKIAKMNEPVVDYLKRFTQHQSLLDIISQHFFQETPAFFALSYLNLYLDYYYPKGGTGQFVKRLVDLIVEHHGEIRNNTKIVEIDTEMKSVTDNQGGVYSYRRLIWAADSRTLYRLVNPEKLNDDKARQATLAMKQLVSDKKGNDSIYTMFLGVDLDKEYFAGKTTPHLFYTPSRAGHSGAGPLPLGQERGTIEKWLEGYLNLTTYEISIPVLRDYTMAPAGKTGLIISVLFDYALVKQIEEQGWYEAFKGIAEQKMLAVLNASIFPGIKDHVHHVFSATPLTLANLTGNHEGAITGWSFTNRPVPAECRLPKIMNAIKTPLPDVYQCGQWTYSPSGLPISLITGKIAADRVIKDLKK